MSTPDTRPDWCTMGRDLFDTAAPTVQTMLDDMPVTDPCGTGDLFTLLTTDERITHHV